MILHKTYTSIKQAITNNNIEDALMQLEFSLQHYPDDANLYYLKGLAHIKLSQWHDALSCFTTSEHINYNEAASASRVMVERIFNFYNKDMYNP